jgi:hypothetical protein
MAKPNMKQFSLLKFASFFTILLSIHCYMPIVDVTNKCEKQKKKIHDCKIRNIITCELFYPQTRMSIDYCTNLDGFLFALLGICDEMKTEDCSSD